MRESGSIIIWLFIAVALFGMLSYAFMQGTRNNLSMIQSEAKKVQSTISADCANTVKAATKRLEARGCGTMISFDIFGMNDSPGAPMDGSCSVFHVRGGGAEVCDVSLATCSESSMQSLAIGQACAEVIYVGIAGGNRIYTDHSNAASASWNNGGTIYTDTPADSVTDGLANTDALLTLVDAGSPYNAAGVCRAKGAKWYLPAPDELQLVRLSRDIGDMAGTVPDGRYWSSRESGTDYGLDINFNLGGAYGNVDISFKMRNARSIRCVRRH